MKYIPVIGMEVHAELKTLSKMFCSCPNGLGLEKEPNIHICPVCTGQPGSLPVPNAEAIKAVQRVGLALGCLLRNHSKFDRKNYFYPDLPKGYQISQYDEPFCEKGGVEIQDEGKTKKFRITRIHLEEDTAKLSHPAGADYTLVDFNRAGVPLMELVTEPDFSTGREASLFCQNLQRVLRYLEVSDADMEKGQMRCEVNISLHREGAERLSGTKVEIKNLNSFRSVERAILYEIKRQTELLDAGKEAEIVQETRGWDENHSVTVSQRKKESAHDYRYFPEPDIPPFEFDAAYLAELKQSLPELPAEKNKRFKEQFGLSPEEADIIIADPALAAYFEAVISELEEKIRAKETTTDIKRGGKLAINYLITELRRHLEEKNMAIADLLVTPENYAEFIGIVGEGKINSSAAQTLLAEMVKGSDGDTDPSHIIDRLNLAQVSDEGALGAIVEHVLSANEKSAADYRAGKENALKYLMGQVMKESKGKANPKIIMELLQKKLN